MTTRKKRKRVIDAVHIEPTLSKFFHTETNKFHWTRTFQANSAGRITQSGRPGQRCQVEVRLRRFVCHGLGGARPEERLPHLIVARQPNFRPHVLAGATCACRKSRESHGGRGVWRSLIRG